jgi:hypothetical protein
MARKTVLILAAMVLSPLLLVTVESSVAQAWPIFPGSVTCAPGAGVWHGTVHFIPPLKNGGAANLETINVSAHLGDVGSQCTTTMIPPAGNMVIGRVAMHLIDFNVPGAANSCGTIFSGSALPAPIGTSALVRHWNPPHGKKTTVKQLPTPFTVEGTPLMNNITITGGNVNPLGSFPAGVPSATLSDAGWPAAIAAGCASAGGLHSLTLSTSTGTW